MRSQTRDIAHGVGRGYFKSAASQGVPPVLNIDRPKGAGPGWSQGQGSLGNRVHCREGVRDDFGTVREVQRQRCGMHGVSWTGYEESESPLSWGRGQYAER